MNCRNTNFRCIYTELTMRPFLEKRYLPRQSVTILHTISILAISILAGCNSSGGGGEESPMSSDTINDFNLRTFSVGKCFPTMPELCGDGIDQNCDGVDPSCPGNDPDKDGYVIGADCDDSNRNIYPGTTSSCTTASNEQGHHICQEGGQFSDCSTSPLCEASGNGNCYYISQQRGDDGNTGAYDAPWRTYRNIISYYTPNERPAGWVGLKAGDVIYFFSGTYSDTFQYGEARETQALFFRGLHGSEPADIKLKAYPGANPRLAPDGQTSAVYILQSSHISISGLEITGAYGAGVKLAEASSIELSNLWIHDIYGVDNNNIGGVSATATSNLRVHHSIVHDCYDRTNSDTGGQKTMNSRNIVLFGGGNNRIDHNVIFQTPSASDTRQGGACIGYKHQATIANSAFEVDNNYLWNCFEHAIGSGTGNTSIHHNILLNGAGVVFKDFGGGTTTSGSVFNNTFINTSAFVFTPSQEWGPIGSVDFYDNIIVDEVDSYSQERGVIRLGTYSPDAVYSELVDGNKFNANANCYFNARTPLLFDAFSANGGNYGSRGGMLNFDAWRDLGFDSGSFAADPQFSNALTPGNPQCQGKGWIN